MRLVLDFDGTIVRDDRDYNDVETPLVLQHGAREALRALVRAGHTLILCSGRANRALRDDWRLNPTWREGKVPFDVRRWERSRSINEARYQQMLRFVELELPDIFTMVDDGAQGKVSGDVFIDDRGLRYSSSFGWPEIAVAFGEPEESGGEP